MGTGFAFRSAAAMAVALVLACGSLPAGRDCSSQADCPADARCTAGMCVADVPPVAVISAPTPLKSNRTLTFHARGSHDPDPGDAVSSYAWDVRAAGVLSPACAPLLGADRGQVELTALFPCAGDFDVSLVVGDDLGLKSAPAVLRAQVELLPDPPQVTAGDDLSTGHRCSGAPLRCSSWDGTSTTVALSAQAMGPLGVGFRYRWTATPPPELQGQPEARAVFLPGPDVRDPQVRLETDGTAIAGRWTFNVVATDSRELSDVARQHVEVGNRPPAVAGGGAVEVPHIYDATGRRFLAAGVTPPVAWSDPDGDPVVSLGYSFVHSGDGAGSFGGLDLGDRASFEVTVPYLQPSDAAFLVGPGPSRRIDLAVADVNGARAGTSFTVTVGNHAPRLALAVPWLAVEHGYDPAGQRYVARASLSEWVDDDGDPLLPSVAGDPLCTEVSEVQGRATVACSMAYPGAPAVDRFAGGHGVTVSMRDPWAAGPSQDSHVEIRNRAPRLLATSAGLTTPCTTSSTCCEPAASHGCSEFDVVVAPAAGMVPLVVDEDGDPLALVLTGDACLSAAPPSQPCAGSGCEIGLALCGGPLRCGAASRAGTLSLVALDGLARTAGSVVVQPQCQ